MKKILRKRYIMTISLLLCLAIGLSVAFSKEISNTLSNTFKVGVVTSEIIEDKPTVNGKIIDKNPKVKNTGSENALVRVRITVSPEGLCSPENLNNSDSILNININNSWEYKNGYYYYLNVVQPQDSIDVFNKVTINNTYNNFEELLKEYGDFEIGIYQETIAASTTNSEGVEKNAYENNQFNSVTAYEIWAIYEGLTN